MDAGDQLPRMKICRTITDTSEMRSLVMSSEVGRDGCMCSVIGGGGIVNFRHERWPKIVAVYELVASWMTGRTQEGRVLSAFGLLFWCLTMFFMCALFLVDHWAFPITDMLLSIWPYDSDNVRSFKSRGVPIAIIPMILALCICTPVHFGNWRSVARRRGRHRDLWKIMVVLFGALLLVSASAYSGLGALIALVVNILLLNWMSMNAARWMLEASSRQEAQRRAKRGK